jgi:hypothetical protein
MVNVAEGLRGERPGMSGGLSSDLLVSYLSLESRILYTLNVMTYL